MSPISFVARLTLPTMAFAPGEKFEVIAAATRGLTELEPDPERRLKQADVSDIDAMRDENERELYRPGYPQEANTLTGFAARLTEQGRRDGGPLWYRVN